MLEERRRELGKHTLCINSVFILDALIKSSGRRVRLCARSEVGSILLVVGDIVKVAIARATACLSCASHVYRLGGVGCGGCGGCGRCGFREVVVEVEEAVVSMEGEYGVEWVAMKLWFMKESPHYRARRW